VSLRQQLKLLLGPPSAGAQEFVESSRLVATLIFAATVAAVVLISFVGVTTANLPVLPNQLASVRVVASAPFTYVSTEKTSLAREQLSQRVPPVFRLDRTELLRFEAAADGLLAGLERLEQTYRPGVRFADNRTAELEALVGAFNAQGPYRASTRDVETILAAGDAAARRGLFDHAYALLGDLAAAGVSDDSAFAAARDARQLAVLQVARPDGTVAALSVRSKSDALANLRVMLADKDTPRDLALALFGFFSNGVAANLNYDVAATHQQQADALKALKPVTVQVERGETIIEPGTRVTPEQIEMLNEHRKYLLLHGDAEFHNALEVFYRVLLVLATVMAGAIFIRLEDRATLHSNGRLALLALVVVFNLALVRLSYALTGLPFFVNDPDSASLLPYLAPTAVAPLLIAILIDVGTASFMALLISIFTSVIYGNRLDLLVLTFLGSMVAIYGTRHTSRRAGVLRASALGGLTVAVFALCLGVVDQGDPLTVLKHMATGLGTGLITGGIVLWLLPVLEGLFKRTTDITFLELTDYNHPLLRRMQLEAPGTYHHSLMVAQLSEHAAASIGANPLLARVCALYHDIGKTMRPEYFGENQRAGINPHDRLPPARSAEIIKAHVDDGVTLALKHKLPRAVVDVIRQHHGTTLVRFFYQRAVEQTRAPFPVAAAIHPTATTGWSGRPPATPPAAEREGNGARPPVPVDRDDYRYDGPRPRFKESAIIHLADGVEAASRSLRDVSPDRLGELIAKIVRDRTDEHQLDEAPLTFAEVSRIKESFARTLLNMTHSRVEYPAMDPAAEAAAEKAEGLKAEG
jgi:hypothetical protein